MNEVKVSNQTNESPIETQVEIVFSPSTSFFDKSLEQLCHRAFGTLKFSLIPVSHYTIHANQLPISEVQQKSKADADRAQLQIRRITVAVGSEAYSKVRQIPGASVASDHCYVIPAEPGQYIIGVPSPKQQFQDPEVTHWIEHGLRKAGNLARQTRSIDPQINIRINPSLVEAIEYISACAELPIVSVDIECLIQSLEITTFAIAKSPTDVMCIPLAGKYLAPIWSEEEELLIWQALQRLLLANNTKIYHNYIFDTMVFAKAGLKHNNLVDCTMIRANALNPLLPKSLKDVARIYLYCEPWKDNKDFNLTGDIDAFYKYNCMDAARTFSIYEHQTKEFAFRKLDTHYNNYIKPLLPLVYDTCCNGINTDTTLLKEMDTQLEGLLAPITSTLQFIGNPLISKGVKKKKLRDKERDADGVKAYKTVTEEIERSFNPASPEQVKEILQTLGYRLPSKRGKESSDREALLKLNRKRPSDFITRLLQYKKLAKLKSSYTAISPDADGKMRFTIKVAGTISGRFGCEKTLWDTGLNIQTLPRGKDPVNIKDIFLPRNAEETLLEVDLSQAELRVVAWLANETSLIKLLANGEDVHQYTADRVTKLSGFNCTRQLGKRIGHASNYGMGPAKFADSCLLEADLAISVSDAQNLLTARARTFPAIARWQDSIRHQISRTRCLTTPYGRTAYFYGPVTDEMHRQALSFIPQAVVSDTINRGWILLSLASNYGSDFIAIMQVHDSLVFSVKSDKLDQVQQQISSVLNNLNVTINNISYNIPHEFKVGDRLGTMKGIK